MLLGAPWRVGYPSAVRLEDGELQRLGLAIPMRSAEWGGGAAPIWRVLTSLGGIGPWMPMRELGWTRSL